MVVDPTPQQLRALTPDDAAILTPPPSKTDAFGVIWGDKPIYLPFRPQAPYCAACRLQELELAFPVTGIERCKVPLFMSDVNVPFTASVLHEVLDDIKAIIFTHGEDPSCFSWHSFRVLLATQLGAAGATDAQIQAICRWQSLQSLVIYRRMQPRLFITLLDKAMQADITSYSTLNLPCVSSTQMAVGIQDYTASNQ